MAETKAAHLVVGAGAWGTAISSRLARDSGANVKLWSRSDEVAKLVNETRVNRDYLPEIQLSENLTASSNLGELISWLNNEPEDATKCLFLATPSKGFYQICSKLQQFNLQNIIFVSLCKGVVFFEGKNYFPSEIIKQHFPNNDVCILSGPSFANEVARGLPFAISCSSDDLNLARKLSIVMNSEGMRVYAISDNIGVEVSGAMKNVLAIASGVCDGLSLGFNARASLITRGMAETVRLGVALGAEKDTFLGLAGAGDLFLTTTGELSRNRKVGKEIASGASLEEILFKLGQVAEGVSNAPKLLSLGRALKVSLPITREVCLLLDRKKDAREALNSLLKREPSDE
ncbi:NAD(P)-dependent glycerol-3-phosphate dehydrogenase [Betaproteobacteria bacterium]|nr:NAD(P)-dependent glycerol-3-phosphate dehydrogenase [Betaproteobacteria bacterium]